MMRVLVVDEALPWPPDSGKRIRTAALLSRLTSHAEIVLAYPGARADGAAEAQARAAGVTPLRVHRHPPRKHGLRFALDLGRNLLLRVPYMVMAHRSRALRDAIAQAHSANPFDLVHVEWTPLLANVPETCRVPIVLAAHNLESDIWDRYRENETRWLRRAYIAEQARKVRRFEHHAFAHADAVTAVSSHDAARIRELAPDTEVVTVPNGVDTATFSPDPDAVVDGERCVFVGALDWRPNQDAVCWLLEDIWPLVRRERPTARCSIVGRKPPPWLQARIAAVPEATLFADLADVRPHVRTAALSVVPLRIGGGSRLKICEALAMSRPVLSTRIGSEGLDLQEALTLADGAPAFARALLDALADPHAQRALAQHGHSLVRAHHDWDGIAPLQHSLWARLAGRS